MTIEDSTLNTNFELEQDILKCWNITSDLREILDDWQQGRMREEDVMQAMDAYVKVYENRFERTFRRFEQQCRNLHELRQQMRAQDLAEPVDTPKKQAKMGKTKQQKEVDH
jgi:DNA repair ATPase RecN